MCVLVVGLAVVLIHRFYLKKMFAHTIGDAHIQRLAEVEMYNLAFRIDVAIKPEYVYTEAFPPKHPVFTSTLHSELSGYGLVQIYITAVLAVAAAAAVWAPRITQQPTLLQTQPRVVPLVSRRQQVYEKTDGMFNASQRLLLGTYEHIRLKSIVDPGIQTRQ